MEDFLKLEYEQCLSLVKYYDERHHSLVKYSAGLSSAIPSIILAFHQVGKETQPYFWEFVSFISLLTSIGLIAIFTVLVQNRLYFIYPVRQVNAIRKKMIISSEAFDENQMYLDTNVSAFKWTSTHTLLNSFVSFQFGIFFGLTMFSLHVGSNYGNWLILSCSIGCVSSALLAFAVAARYLIKKGQKNPDQSVHNNHNGSEV